jgi:hypothetical protein
MLLPRGARPEICEQHENRDQQFQPAGKFHNYTTVEFWREDSTKIRATDEVVKIYTFSLDFTNGKNE